MLLANLSHNILPSLGVSTTHWRCVDLTFKERATLISYIHFHHLGYLGVDGRLILRWIFRKWNVGVWTGSSWLRIGTGGGHLWMG